MKHLFLLRHAQAGSSLGIEDHERPLTSQGRGDAERLGVLLGGGERRPALALCSSARRAQETLELILRCLDPPPPTEVERRLYLATAAELLERLSEVDNRVGTVLLVGHNPAIAELTSQLAGEGEGDALSRLGRGVPAGTLAALHQDQGGWADLAPGRSYLTALLAPSDLE
jgi:phosphohistidine phosphatase